VLHIHTLRWNVPATYRVRLRALPCPAISPACYEVVVEDGAFGAELSRALRPEWRFGCAPRLGCAHASRNSPCAGSYIGVIRFLGGGEDGVLAAAVTAIIQIAPHHPGLAGAWTVSSGVDHVSRA
jgi:hypothetical protein